MLLLLRRFSHVRPHRRQPIRLLCPWDSPGKNTGVGCHFLLQCMKVKRESEVAQSCLTLSNPMDCSLPGSSIHGIFQAGVNGVESFCFSNISSSWGIMGKSLEKEMATHSSILAWRIPMDRGTWSMGSQRVGHDWATSLSLFTFMH